MRQWPLRTKLAVSFLIVVLLAVAQAGAAYRTLRLYQSASQWVEHTYQVIAEAGAAQAQVDGIRAAYRSYLLTGDPDFLQTYHAAKAELEVSLSGLERDTADNPPQVARWKDIQARVTSWVNQVVQPDLAKMEASGGSTGVGTAIAANSLPRTEEELNVVGGLFRQAVSTEHSLLAQRVQDATMATAELGWILVGGVIVLIVVGLTLAVTLSGSLGVAFARLARAARLLAEGRLDERIYVERDDEIGQTAKAFNSMADQLERVVGDLREQVLQREQAERALENANRELSGWVSQLEERDRHSSLLSEAGQLLQSCRAVSEAYEVVTAILPRLFPTHPAALGVINESRNLLEIVADNGRAGATEQIFTPGDCWALRLGRPHRVVNVGGGVYCEHLGPRRPLISLCVPLQAQGQALGLLHLSVDEPGDGQESFASSERAAGLLADQIGLALANLRLRETLRTQALRDPLTGMFNRRYLEETLEREISRAQRRDLPLSLVMLDIDHFKRLNDTFGHQIGDEVLRQVARVLMAEIRAGDLACRYGGEEFTLILPEAQPADAAIRVDHVREAIANHPMTTGQRSYGPVTVSFGVAGFPVHGASGEALIRAADAALYRAKRNGRNRVEIADSNSPDSAGTTAPA